MIVSAYFFSRVSSWRVRSFAGVDDHGHAAVLLALLHPLEEREAALARQLQVEDHAVEARGLERGERLVARPDRDDVHVVADADELDDRLALVLVVLDHEQVADTAVDEGRERGERVLEPLARDGLLEERDRAGPQRLLAAVAAGDDVHRDVPRRRVALQPVEQRRAVDHRQLEVEQDRVGLVLVREREAGVAAERDERLEPTLAGDLLDGAGELGVVLDDEDDPVAVAELVAVVGHLARQQERAVELLDGLGGEVAVGRRRERRGSGRAFGRRRVGRGQVQREGRALAGARLDPDLAAEQHRDLAADRQPEARCRRSGGSSSRRPAGTPRRSGAACRAGSRSRCRRRRTPRRRPRGSAARSCSGRPSVPPRS